MSSVATAIVGGAVIGAYASSKSASKAAKAQENASNAAIAEEQRQLTEVQKLLAPYVAAGEPALAAQQALIGLSGQEKQRQAIKNIEQGAGFQALARQGESAILQNASATGGLRGGNVQAALAQFRPAMLSQAINDQYSRLAGMTSIGQNAAAGVGNAGMQTGGAVSGLLQQQGAAQAGGYLAQGQAMSNLGAAIPQAYGAYRGFNNQPAQAPVQQQGTSGTTYGSMPEYGF